ncbi:S-layer family protein [Acaryochloris marina]|uniref:beta strand repeat-containing protein n=1 Tax=Acaryochloris marina TaxID=155978 RepID=UPI001BAF6DA7|nr:S-layer family protein [Acaryochloris marina]QUY44228.1 S-layer family protein [Acaryochloris marina S15]
MVINIYKQYLQLGSTVLILSGVIFTTNIKETKAEAIPDSSLGIEASIVIPNQNINGRPASLVQGGAVRNAATVFHSFERFSISESQAIYFDNPSRIKTIVSRVTGISPSDINGTLGLWNSLAGTLGNADLFFINSRGISFGPKAALDLNGSFLASTATSINFGDDYQFSTVNPTAPPLLTINVPTGLQISSPKSTISSQATFNIIPLPTFGLNVMPGNTLALVGGDILIQGGSVGAPEGRIELGGVLNGEVGLQPDFRGWKLDYSQIQNYRDILVDKQSIVAANGVGGGEIRLQGKNIVIDDNSRIFATVNFGAEPGGIIEIDASEILQIRNGSGIFTSTLADGDAGDILIKADKVFLQNDAAIATDSAFINLGFFLMRANGNSGNIYITAPESVEIINNSQISTTTNTPGNAGLINIETGRLVARESSLFPAINSVAEIGSEGDAGDVNLFATQFVQINNSSISTSTAGLGDAGDLKINTSELLLTNGGRLEASTVGSGKGGNIAAFVSDQINISGNTPNAGQPSGIFSIVEVGASGAGGQLLLSTGQVVIDNGGQISTSTTGFGAAGKIDIRASQGVTLIDPGSGVFANTTDTGQGGTISLFTPNFLIEKGAVVNASTSGNGRGGSIFIRSNRFTARQGGQLLSTASGQGPAGDITLQVRDNITLIGANSGLFASTTPDSTGAAGNIFIDPIQVLITNGAAVSATSLGMGKGGDIQLRARNLTLDQGQITAEAAVAPAGDIQLNIANFLLLRNGSLISTTAGGDATGGNIDINAQLVTAFPSENSDITANALNGPGGNITITTQGVFGLEVRDTLTNSSDIAAFSQTNPQLNGIVEIITPEVDPSENLSEQPDAVEKPTEISRGCNAQTASSSFVSKGRGGLPHNPATALSSEAIWQDLRAQEIQSPVQSISQMTPKSTPQAPVAAPFKWVEAKAWQRLPNGKVKLVGNSINQNTLHPAPSC